MENPPDVIYKMKLHEVAKYYTITEHAFASVVILSSAGSTGCPGSAGRSPGRKGDDRLRRRRLYEVAGPEPRGDAQGDHVTTFPADELQKMKELAQKGVWTA